MSSRPKCLVNDATRVLGAREYMQKGRPRHDVIVNDQLANV